MKEANAIRGIPWAGLYALTDAGVELVFQPERSSWRLASMREVVGLVRNVTFTTGLIRSHPHAETRKIKRRPSS